MSGRKKKQPAARTMVREIPAPTRIKQVDINENAILKKYNPYALGVFILFFLLFCVSVFTHIRYPLFWADESFTVMGGKRVLEYGYPKVHDGKNVLYDLPHSDPALGIDKKTDAYVGGPGWLAYYLAAIGVSIAGFFDDIYTKTGIIRSLFALTGLFGMLLFVRLMSQFFEDRFSKFLFAGIFFATALLSVSLTLTLREVRYYSLNLLLVCFITGYYALVRFKKGNKKRYALFAGIGLYLLYHAFPPSFFITAASLGLSELVIFVNNYLRKRAFKTYLLESIPFLIPMAASGLLILIFLPYFRTFEIARALAEFNNFSARAYWENVNSTFRYFWKFDLLWLAILLKLILMFRLAQLLKQGDPRIRASLFFSLLFLLYCFGISRIPNFTYTRYFLPAFAFLWCSIIMDGFILVSLARVRSPLAFQMKAAFVFIFALLIMISTMVRNYDDISGHMTEMSEQYKGPLDYIIPYIQEKYTKTDSLVIATNYEESSFMYYLDSKVIVGFIGNNLEEDRKMDPHILSFRKKWNKFPEVFNEFATGNEYEIKTFPVYDSPVNNIPELNFIEDFNHLYETKSNTSEADAADLFIRVKQ
jgi:hypothetical protein